jgi:hypothetical protein
VTLVKVCAILTCTLAGFYLGLALSPSPLAWPSVGEASEAVTRFWQIPNDLSASVHVSQSQSFLNKHLEVLTMAFKTSPLVVGVTLLAALVSMVRPLGRFLRGE